MITNMLGPDSFYTPMPLADRLVSYIIENKIDSVIDFCVGDGNLLKAVQNKFENLHFFGTDISEHAINSIAKNNNWSLGVCDFRDDSSIEKIPFLHNRKFDLIVLNPPFTCKGGIAEPLLLDGQLFKVSTAMLFLMKAVSFLSSRGGLYAILPISCVYSQKDRKAWEYLQSQYNACVLEEPERYCFGEKCAPNIVLVYLGHQVRKIERNEQYVDFKHLSVVHVVRGCVRMQNLAYSDSSESLPLIHTTNIRDGHLENLKCISKGSNLVVEGHGVIIPRVCNPNKNKIALLDGKSKYLLSDCVMVLSTNTMKDAIHLRNYILGNWTSFMSIYKGTGAKYTTLERVRTMFGVAFE